MDDAGETARPGGSDDERGRAYWKSNLRLLSVLFAIWFLVSLGAGVIFADALNAITVFGFPLGFWFAQQGSILTFVVLIAVYAVLMGRLDRRHGYTGQSDDDGGDA